MYFTALSNVNKQINDMNLQLEKETKRGDLEEYLMLIFDKFVPRSRTTLKCAFCRYRHSRFNGLLLFWIVSLEKD